MTASRRTRAAAVLDAIALAHRLRVDRARRSLTAATRQVATARAEVERQALRRNAIIEEIDAIDRHRRGGGLGASEMVAASRRVAALRLQLSEQLRRLDAEGRELVRLQHQRALAFNAWRIRTLARERASSAAAALERRDAARRDARQDERLLDATTARPRGRISPTAPWERTT